MLSQVEQTRLPSYRIGMQQGEGKLLERQIIRRFGIQVMSESLRHRLATARVDEQSNGRTTSWMRTRWMRF